MAALTLILALLVAQPVFVQAADVTTREGIVLKTVFKKPAAGKRTLVMLHGWKAVKEEWGPLITVLEKDGWGYLAYDARPNGPGMKFIDDVGMVLKYLESQGIKRDTVSLAGASLGANVILGYAALTGFKGSLVALSPGLDYGGLKMEPMVPRVKAQTLMAVSKTDEYAAASAKELAKLNSNVTLWDDAKTGHGVQMFNPEFLKRLMAWLNAN